MLTTIPRFLSCIVLVVVGLTPLLNAQSPGTGRYWVYFTDKSDPVYSLLKPEAFLSERALDRRARFGLSVDSTDLPVTRHYVGQIRKRGHHLFHTSKWYNAALVLADSLSATQLLALPFVKKVEYVGPELMKKSSGHSGETSTSTISGNYTPLDNYYGYGALQIGMANGHILHYLGYRGAEKWIAVFDGGFQNVPIMPFFDSLRVEGRLLAGRDFVDADDYLYESSIHGTQVLSTMASNLPGLLVGSAPEATYLLFKTEDVRRESKTEECNWIAAAEYADSAGVDIINSSLGYTTFSEKFMNYTYEDMNGTTARISSAADLAFSKGMIVVNSAGNEGNSSWHYIGAPADGRHVFSIGAVDPTGAYAPFSSVGPTADGRIKPDIAVMGQGVIVASPSTCDVLQSSGTSFASPLAAGMVASLWQAFPDKSNQEILDAIRNSGSQALNPDYKLGYGIPDFWKAFLTLLTPDYKAITQEAGTFSTVQKGVFFLPEIVEGKQIHWYNFAGIHLGSQPLAPGINALPADIMRQVHTHDFLIFRLDD